MFYMIHARNEIDFPRECYDADSFKPRRVSRGNRYVKSNYFRTMLRTPTSFSFFLPLPLSLLSFESI